MQVVNGVPLRKSGAAKVREACFTLRHLPRQDRTFQRAPSAIEYRLDADEKYLNENPAGKHPAGPPCQENHGG